MPSRRPGSSYLECVMALVVLGVALGGLCPLVVVQSRLLRRIERPSPGSKAPALRGLLVINGTPRGLDEQVVYRLVPQGDPIARGLGSAASFRAVDTPGPPGPETQAADATADTPVVRPDGSADPVVFTLPVPLPGYYHFWITWTGAAANAPDATCTLLDGDGLAIAGPFDVDEQSDPSDDDPASGHRWLRLGGPVFVNGPVTVRLDAPAPSHLVADAARITPLNNVGPPEDVARTIDSIGATVVVTPR